ncbi:hypothetical protein P154DRAFT_569764 [Amniculicola lignicola CBS 123094]|uniref:Uncharacterized protein n=1 Tax=Amniculicola lignicola CBS 123094 TaxID=1392246 RepID=A0A6A5X0V7_9PLEO|nr:hypothetical protein P154DRAFT_569764 [Amniculicola lignicola CBS 123094]
MHADPVRPIYFILPPSPASPRHHLLNVIFLTQIAYISVRPQEIRQTRDKAYLPEWNYASTASRSTLHLADYLFIEEQDPLENDYRHWRIAVCDFLASIQEPILLAALDGSLPRKHISKSGNIAKYFNAPEGLDDVNYWYARKEIKFAPGIYIRYLTDAKGLSPAPIELVIIVEKLEAYASGDRAVGAKIENACVYPEFTNSGNMEEDRFGLFGGTNSGTETGSLRGQNETWADLLEWCEKTNPAYGISLRRGNKRFDSGELDEGEPPEMTAALAELEAARAERKDH